MLEEYLVPTAVVLIANLLSGPHGSLRWEAVTAIFGWTSLAATAAVAIGYFLFANTGVYKHAIQILYFSLITALSRNWEKVLKPIADRLIQRRPNS